MIDIDHLKQNIDAYKRALYTKRITLDFDELIEVMAQRRNLESKVQALRETRNMLSARIAQNKEPGLLEQAKQTRIDLGKQEEVLRTVEERFQNLIVCVPNLPAEHVPVGETDADNVEVRRVGVIPQNNFNMLDHIELAARHTLVDFEAARKVAGSRAYALRGLGALLQQAIMRFTVDFIVDRGFELVLPPLAVNSKAMFGTGYFPFGEDNAYHLERDDMWLTGTSEVGIVAMHADQIFNADQLPIKLTGISTCFRREAGAAGRDTRGLYRVHQFEKVEQIIICENNADASALAHAALLQNAEELLQALELPYRVVEVCTGDMGLGQVRKHDIETWMPSRNAYGETHSCSTFHEFQARRLNIKYRDKNQKLFVHTLNNTAIASPRILIPLLENNQNQDGTIRIPEVLRTYMRGLTQIG